MISTTGESTWEQPVWMEYFEEEEKNSTQLSTSSNQIQSIPYYVNTLTSETQWEKPSDFVPIVREEVCNACFDLIVILI